MLVEGCVLLVDEGYVMLFEGCVMLVEGCVMLAVCQILPISRFPFIFIYLEKKHNLQIIVFLKQATDPMNVPLTLLFSNRSPARISYQENLVA